MKKRNATIVGFIVASAIPALQFVVLAVVASTQYDDATFSESALLGAVTLLVFYPYSILFTAAFGVPLYLIAKRLDLVNWWFSLLGGALVGVCLSVIFRSTQGRYLEDVLRFVPVATASAFAFWLIWRTANARTTPPVE